MHRIVRLCDSDEEVEEDRDPPSPTVFADPFRQRSSSPFFTSRRTQPSMEQPRQASARRPTVRSPPRARRMRPPSREEDTPFLTIGQSSLRSMGAMSLSDDPLSRLSSRRSPRAQDVQAAARVPKSTQRLLVVAIDFGTTYSGFAFSYKSDFEADPLRVQCLNIQSGKEEKKSQAAKVPTAILFTPDKELDSFGYEAQEKYAKMDPTDAIKWYMFDCFKMELHSSKSLSRDRALLDKTKKKSMKALDVFSGAIRHLKEHALRELVQGQRGGLVEEEEITWVLTVPAIWDDSAKQFMREAATQAGLDNSRLELALEPESASIYCLNYFKAHQTSPGTASLSRKGARFLTVDCGGGTVDLSVFEVEDGARLKQLHKPEGAACGGTMVDKAFKDLLMQILGFDGLTAVNNFENLTLMREFEKAKLAIGVARKIAIKIPTTMKEQLSITLQNSPLEDEVTLVNNNLMVNGKTAEAFFKKSIDGIVEAMKKVLRSPQVVQVDAILLVGGFSESRVIQDAVKAAFPRDQVLVPPSPSLTVVMGAVQFGHRSGVIATRMAAFTYGIEVEENFVEDYHDPSKRKVIGGQDCCTQVFDSIIKVNDVVAVDQALPFHTISPAESGQKIMHLKIYRSPQPPPRYITDEDCAGIGSVTVKMPDLTGERQRQVQVSMSVSGTELKVVARDQNTKREFSTTCDLLG